jgi:CheY-like chemotaxis protein
VGIETMIVDDQADVRQLIRVVIELANRGLSVSAEAGSGPEALEQLEHHEPTVVVLDEMMPEMSGLETVAAIRERRPDQPIILFSAFLDRRLREQAEAAGVSACVPKEDVAKLPDVIRSVAR